MRGMFVVAAMLAAQGLGAQQAPADRASLFVRRGCADCHAISALNVKAKTDVGPDLTFAHADVRERYGMTLDEFFDQPPGVMRLVLGVHIQLKRVECDSLVQLFRDLYAEHLARADSLTRRGPVRGNPRSATLRRIY